MRREASCTGRMFASLSWVSSSVLGVGGWKLSLLFYDEKQQICKTSVCLELPRLTFLSTTCHVCCQAASETKLRWTTALLMRCYRSTSSLPRTSSRPTTPTGSGSVSWSNWIDLTPFSFAIFWIQFLQHVHGFIYDFPRLCICWGLSVIIAWLSFISLYIAWLSVPLSLSFYSCALSLSLSLSPLAPAAAGLLIVLRLSIDKDIDRYHLLKNIRLLLWKSFMLLFSSLDK